MIANAWLIMSAEFRAELEGTVGSMFVQPVKATRFPRLNNPTAKFKDALREVPDRGVVNYSLVPGVELWSAYVTADYLGELAAMRDYLRKLEKEYFPDFYVGGMWDFHTGEPLGGSGSPWFQTPFELETVLGGPPRDVSLNAGQHPRAFV